MRDEVLEKSIISDHNKKVGLLLDHNYEEACGKNKYVQVIWWNMGNMTHVHALSSNLRSTMNTSHWNVKLKQT